MSAKNLNIILCGTGDFFSQQTWSGTYRALQTGLAKKVNIVGYIDYSVKNKYILALHKIYSHTFLGIENSIRDNFINYFMEREFIRQYLKIGKKVDFFFHVSALCIPARLANEAAHITYTDAAVAGFEKYAQVRLSKRFLKMFKSTSNIYVHRLALVFTFNRWTQKAIVDDFGIPENRIINAKFGINLEKYNGPKNYANKKLLIVLRRGRERDKGLWLLLEAFLIVRSSIPEVTLSIVGTTLDKQIEGIECFENFPREKTKELFREASLYTMPALFEVNGITYLESLACKTPILGLNRLAFPEFAGYGKYGYIVDDPSPECVARTIVDALSDPARLRSMGEAGQAFALKNYQWDRVVNNIIIAMERIVANGEKQR